MNYEWVVNYELLDYQVFFMKVAQASILKERNPNGLIINS